MIQKLKSKEGASIILALILMIVFLTIGISVLTAATVSMNGAKELMQSKRLYYFARSVAGAVEDGITTDGVLGEYLTGYIEDNAADIASEIAASGTGTAAFEVEMQSGDMPEEFKDGPSNLNMEPLGITLKNVSVDNDGILLAIGKMTVNFEVKYEDQVYKLSADYAYQRSQTGTEGWRLVKYYQ